MISRILQRWLGCYLYHAAGLDTTPVKISWNVTNLPEWAPTEEKL